MIRSFKQEKSYLKRQITKVKNLSKKFDGVHLYFAIDLSKRDVFDRMGRAVRTYWSEDEKKEYHKLGVDYLKVAFEIRDNIKL